MSGRRKEKQVFHDTAESVNGDDIFPSVPSDALVSFSSCLLTDMKCVSKLVCPHSSEAYCYKVFFQVGDEIPFTGPGHGAPGPDGHDPSEGSLS